MTDTEPEGPRHHVSKARQLLSTRPTVDRLREHASVGRVICQQEACKRITSILARAVLRIGTHMDNLNEIKEMTENEPTRAPYYNNLCAKS